MTRRRRQPPLWEVIRRGERAAAAAGIEFPNPASRHGTAEEVAAARAELDAVDQALTADLRQANKAARAATPLFTARSKFTAATWRHLTADLDDDDRAAIRAAEKLARQRTAVRNAAAILAAAGAVGPLAELVGKVPAVARCVMVRTLAERWQTDRSEGGRL